MKVDDIKSWITLNTISSEEVVAQTIGSFRTLCFFANSIVVSESIHTSIADVGIETAGFLAIGRQLNLNYLNLDFDA